MKTPPADREAEALDRFQEDEHLLDADLDAARRDAASLIAAARADAEAILRMEAESAARECAALRATAEQNHRRLVAATRDELLTELEVLAHRTTENERATLTWLLSIVSGADGGGAP